MLLPYGVAFEPFPCVGKTLLYLCMYLKIKQSFLVYRCIEVEMFMHICDSV